MLHSSSYTNSSVIKANDSRQWFWWQSQNTPRPSFPSIHPSSFQSVSFFDNMLSVYCSIKMYFCVSLETIIVQFSSVTEFMFHTVNIIKIMTAALMRSSCVKTLYVYIMNVFICTHLYWITTSATHLILNMPLCQQIDSWEEKWNVHTILLRQAYHGHLSPTCHKYIIYINSTVNTLQMAVENTSV